MKHLPEPSVPFPVIVDEFAEAWRWPAPPFVWRHEPARDLGDPQPVTIEVLQGHCVDGELLSFDPAGASLTFRTAADRPDVKVPFSRIRRLTLTTPLKPVPSKRGAPVERVPAAAQERDYVVRFRAAGSVMSGTTLGHVESDEGLFLFPPTDEEMSVRRTFVPRSAYAAVEFGATAEELASRRWITSPAQLLEAVERRQRRPVLPIGQALLDLGLVTRKQLDRALAQKTPDVPLGEMFTVQGIVSRADLDTALAYKMGHPIVDLARFPIDVAAAQRVPFRLALWARGLPLAMQGNRIVAAVDKPSRLARLQTVKALAGIELVPVLACKSKIVKTLSDLAVKGVWTDHVAAMPGYFATTV
jgi:hypothetical protein